MDLLLKGVLMRSLELTQADEALVEKFAGSLFEACLASMELANIELGARLGLYEALAEAGPMTAGELASRSGIVERYAREWLEQQAVAGVVTVDDVTMSPDERRFELPKAHAHVLLDENSDAYMRMCASVVPWMAKALDIMEVEFQRGAGVAFEQFEVHDIQAAMTRPVFMNHLTQNWLRALPELQAMLDDGAPVRIAEVGCGEGLAAIRIALAYPNAQVYGFDLDEPSIRAALEAAAKAGVADRTHFEVRDAADPEIKGDFDLVMAIEMIHDVPDPVGVLRTMRTLAGSKGTVLVVDERADAAFNVPTTEMERFFYAFSTLHCLAVSMQNNGAGTGTVIRPETVREYATEAGFTSVETLGVAHPQFVLYRLTSS